jgi:hypothetical protein
MRDIREIPLLGQNSQSRTLQNLNPRHGIFAHNVFVTKWKSIRENILFFIMQGLVGAS